MSKWRAVRQASNVRDKRDIDKMLLKAFGSFDVANKIVSEAIRKEYHRFFCEVRDTPLHRECPSQNLNRYGPLQGHGFGSKEQGRKFADSIYGA
jgi:hypothetical protein